MKLKELVQDAVTRYPTATPAERTILETVYGKNVFLQNSKLKITERVKTIEDIYTIAGVDPTTMVLSDGMTTRERYAIINEKIRLIAQVLNEGVKLDWADTNQYKWFPWFKVQGSAFVFTRSLYDYVSADASLGSRFASQELSDFAGKTFLREYTDFLNAQ